MFPPSLVVTGQIVRLNGLVGPTWRRSLALSDCEKDKGTSASVALPITSSFIRDLSNDKLRGKRRTKKERGALSGSLGYDPSQALRLVLPSTQSRIPHSWNFPSIMVPRLEKTDD